MTFSELWRQLERKDRRLADDNGELVLKTADLKKLLRQVYEQGQGAAKGCWKGSLNDLFPF